MLSTCVLGPQSKLLIGWSLQLNRRKEHDKRDRQCTTRAPSLETYLGQLKESQSERHSAK